MPNVLFVHPDLGIGGAERLIVDAALALQEKGHSVHIVTSHHDRSHCFEETIDGTLPVTVFGDWFPKSIFGRFHALFAYTRMIYISLYLLFSPQFTPDVIICDLVSVVIPFLKLKCKNVVLYCHFPDQLLSKPGGFMKTVYRSVINKCENITTKLATKIFVNSKFTQSVFLKTFTNIDDVPEILYPSLHTRKFDQIHTVPINDVIGKSLPNSSTFFLSLNRYERKKNIALAISAFSHLKSLLQPEQFAKCHLVVAGGYDEQLMENVEHFGELENLIASLDLTDKVTMLKSPSEAAKISLIKCCQGLLYTPSNEHFGIVPVEAMYLETPVIAVNSGGPTETIVDSKTGFLCESEPEKFADAMKVLIVEESMKRKLGGAGRQRVLDNFSFDSFASQLDNSVKRLCD